MDQYPNTYKPNEEDSEIDLRDLLYYILRQWRRIFVCALVFCVLLGGFKLVKGFSMLKSTDTVENQKSYQSELDAYNITKSRLEDQIEELTQSIQDKGEYHEQSILMNLNPDAAYKSSLTYIVNASRDDALVENSKELHPVINRRMNSALGAYASLIQNGSILSDVQEKLATTLSKKYLAELVYVQTDYQAKLLHVTVVGETREQVQAITDAVEEGLQNVNASITTPVADYHLSLLSSYIGDDAGTNIPIETIPEEGTNENDAIYQTSIEALQKNYMTSVADMQEQLSTCKEQLNKLEEPSAPAGISRNSVLKEGVKYAVLGAVAGAFLMALFYAMRYLLSGKLLSADYLNDNYGLMVLADYHPSIKEDPHPIDKLIDQMTGISDEKRSLEGVYTLGAANILAQLSATKTSKVLLIGNAAANDFYTAANALSQKLSVAGVEAVIAGNVNADASAVQKLKDAEPVVLIEQCGVSRQQEIQKELQMLRKLGKEIIGAIVL